MLSLSQCCLARIYQKKPSTHRALRSPSNRWLSTGVLVSLLTGCSTYGGKVDQAFDQLDAKDYQTASNTFKQHLKPKGKNALLYYSELGMVEHLAGNYQKSNQLLSTAEAIAEDQYTKRFSDSITSLLTGSDNATYKGKPAEHIFYNSLKALNYLQLATAAQQAGDTSARLRHLDSARVEARRVDLKLREIERTEGSYQQAEAQRETLLYQLLPLFQLLTGVELDRSELKFRQNAYSHYLAGITYEKNREWDNARISYQKAAELYEQGYAKQLNLGQAIIEQAWLDLARVMQKAGGYGNRLRQIKARKLSKTSLAQLRRAKTARAELVLVEHAGWVPRLGEMNIYMGADVDTQEFVLRPVLLGSDQQKLDQFHWFYLLYADKGLLSLVQQYQQGGLLGVATRFGQEKRIGVGPFWENAQQQGLVDIAANQGIRVAVPYYAPLSHTAVAPTQVQVNQQSYSMITAESPAALTLQNQLLQAGGDLTLAFARAAIQQISAAKTSQLGGQETGQLIGSLLSLGASFTAQADTRSWLTLPHEIRIKRLYLSPGNHQISVPGQKPKQITLVDNDIQLVEFRTHNQRKSALKPVY